MIPTLILLGLIFGRWWRPTIIAAAIAWPAFLLANGTIGFGASIMSAAALAVINTAVGAALHQALLHLTRLIRRRAASNL